MEQSAVVETLPMSCRDGRAPQRVLWERVAVRLMPLVVPLRAQAQNLRCQVAVARPPYLVEEESGDGSAQDRRVDDGQESVRTVGHRCGLCLFRKRAQVMCFLCFYKVPSLTSDGVY